MIAKCKPLFCSSPTDSGEMNQIKPMDEKITHKRSIDLIDRWNVTVLSRYNLLPVCTSIQLFIILLIPISP